MRIECVTRRAKGDLGACLKKMKGKMSSLGG